MMIGALLWVFLGFNSPSANGAPYKVLVVMSYQVSFSWVQEIKEGIDAVLAGDAIIRYFYMDTKTHIEKGPEKAKEAYALYKKYKPEGVIAADDNAQSMFVVPYLKDKVKTPVMFCGVNADPEKYGYPAANVSGIIERLHIAETIAFTQQLMPQIKSVASMMKDSPTAKLVSAQFQNESHMFPARFIGFRQPKNIQEVKTMSIELRDQCDVLAMETMLGTLDENGNPLTDKEVIPIVVETFKKPIITTNAQMLKYGLLCAVNKSGQEQGAKAAAMLLKAMQGTPVTDIPMVRNTQGRRYLNVTEMKTFGIKPKPILLKGAVLVKTVNRGNR